MLFVKQYGLKKIYYEDEVNYPTRKLFLDILSPIENHEEKKVYDFLFLIQNEHKDESISRVKQISDENGNSKEIECFWFEVGNILEFKSEHNVITYLTKENLDISGFETYHKLISTNYAGWAILIIVENSNFSLILNKNRKA